MGDDQDKCAQYVQDYLNKEGVQLEPDNIQKNPGQRSLAKMMLNSFWGKYGQQGNKSQVEAISEPSQLHELLNDDTHIVQTLRVTNDEMIELVYKQVDDEESVQVNINILVACFTTCWARLKLYREGLCKVPPERVLYFDTDSIIFSHPPGEAHPPTGDHLGEFIGELKPGDHIVEFAATGPKNYGYRTKDGKLECKVRGFTLNTRGQEQLNPIVSLRLHPSSSRRVGHGQCSATTRHVKNPLKFCLNLSIIVSRDLFRANPAPFH